MDFNVEDWRTTDVNVDSLWLINARAKDGKHSNIYHGNFVPQIPNNMIRRYTSENDVVLDMFMGSGTTLFECEKLSRKFIGFDINDDIIGIVEEKMASSNKDFFFIHNTDITQTEPVKNAIGTDLQNFHKGKVDLIISHPPYMDIIRFSDKPEDLSRISDLGVFFQKYVEAVDNCWHALKKHGYFVLVVGDIYRGGEVVPLGFDLMYAIRKNFRCKLKGILVKNMIGNRGKIGTENLWKYRALKNGTFLFKHEYVFVFRKEE